MVLGLFYLVGAVFSLGSAAVFLCLVISRGNANWIRFIRVLTQTTFIVLGYLFLYRGPLLNFN